MTPQTFRFIPWISSLAAFVAAMFLAAPPSPALRTEQAPLLPRVGFLRVLFAGQLPLVADYFWIITINRVGGVKTPQDARDIYYYADLVADLDPKFRHVYPFAGVAIPIKVGRDYANAELSTRLLRKGVQHLPNDYKTGFLLGYNLVFFHESYAEAAEIFKGLQSHSAAPPWLGKLASRLYAQSGDLSASEALTAQLLQSAEDEETRQAYALRLKEIAQERVLRELDVAAEKFARAEGRRPENFNELVQHGYVARELKDPLEGWFYFDKDGRARTTASRSRLEVFQMKSPSEAAPTTPP